MNFETIRKYINADSFEFGTVNAEYIDSRERIIIKYDHNFLSELHPNQYEKL